MLHDLQELHNEQLRQHLEDASFADSAAEGTRAARLMLGSWVGAEASEQRKLDEWLTVENTWDPNARCAHWVRTLQI